MVLVSSLTRTLIKAGVRMGDPYSHIYILVLFRVDYFNHSTSTYILGQESILLWEAATVLCLLGTNTKTMCGFILISTIARASTVAELYVNILCELRVRYLRQPYINRRYKYLYFHSGLVPVASLTQTSITAVVGMGGPHSNIHILFTGDIMLDPFNHS